jgi:hypothetical protein
MLKKLLEYLIYEEKLIGDLLMLATKQKEALAGYDISSVGKIALAQESVARKLKLQEEQRIKLLMDWLELGRKDALSIKLSMIEKKLNGPSLDRVKAHRESLRVKIAELSEVNKQNQILANRGRKNVGQMMGLFTSGQNRVCNVVV